MFNVSIAENSKNIKVSNFLCQYTGVESGIHAVLQCKQLRNKRVQKLFYKKGKGVQK